MIKNIIFAILLILCSCAEAGKKIRTDNFYVEGLGYVTVWVVHNGTGGIYEFYNIHNTEDKKPIMVNGVEYIPK